LLDPDTRAITAVSLFGPVERIDAPAPTTVVVTFKSPYPLFLTQIRRPYFGILSPRQLDGLKPGDKISAPIGTGPYRFAGRSADGVVTLEAYADYAWGSEVLTNRAAPYLQGMNLRAISDAATREATLESGENLLIDDLSEADYARLKSDPRFRFVTSPRVGSAIGFYLNVKRAPTDDLAVRQAINWAVDRKSIVDKLYFGVHKTAVGIFSEGVWSRLDKLESTYTYDPAKARQLLDGAGWSVGSAGPIRQKNGQPLALVLATFRSPWTEIAEAMQAQLRDVGIDLKIQKLARGPYLDFIRQYQHNLCATSGADIDPDVLRQRFVSSGIGMDNFANVADPQLDALFARGAQQATGSDERRQTYEAIQMQLMEMLPFVSVMSQVRVEAMSARVHELRMEPDGVNALATSDVWLEA
jgi:peptide/nickel transport system substrate-binding protein